jgi:hypothetical protein
LRAADWTILEVGTRLKTEKLRRSTCGLNMAPIAGRQRAL